MSADPFEARVADFIQDGPSTVSESLIDAVLAYPATHRRSATRRIKRRLARFGPLVAAVVVAALALGVAPSLVGPAAPTGPATVSGSQRCEIRVTGARIYSQDGVDELRGQVEACEDVVSDSRVTGTQIRHVEAWLFAPDAVDADGSSDYYGNLEISNASGRWSGSFVATFSGQSTDRPGRLSWIVVGSGGYQGHVYRATVTTTGDGVRSIAGSIETISGAALTGDTWCWVTVARPDLSVEDAAHRELERECIVRSSDDRLAGRARESRLIDVAVDGTTTDTGELRITTLGGGWSGPFAGTGDWYVPGRVTGTLLGQDGFAGQRLKIEIVSEDGMHGALLATLALEP